ncbi:MAG: glycosyltransferase family 39 protein [Gemmatimonadota bacterium]|nr:MAG: glycosyltransferase family 39 protein [Gemmatimonadota bacterium]
MESKVTNLKKTGQKTQVMLFVFLASLYMLMAAGYPATSMGVTAALTAKSFVEEGNLSLEKATLETGIGKDGKYYTYEGLAFILAVTIFAAISKLLGMSPNGVLFTNQILTALACLILFYVSREFKYSKKVSLVLSLIYGIGTMALVHSRYLMPEPLTTLVYLTAFLFLLKYKNKNKVTWLFLCGCFTGLSIIVRPDAPLFILGMIVGVVVVFYTQYRDGRKKLDAIVREGVLFLTPLVFFFGVYAYYNHARFGNIFESGYSTKGRQELDSKGYESPFRVRSMTDTLLGFAGMWIIPCRSMFFINPVLIFIFFALTDFWKKYRYELLIIGIIFIPHVIVYSNRGPSSFPGGGSWGIRYMVPMTSFMVIIMGIFVERIMKHRNRIFKIFVAVFVLSAFFQFIGASRSYQDTQHYLEKNYNTPEDDGIARRMMNVFPKWNLITQNINLLRSGNTDFMYHGYLTESKLTYFKLQWGSEAPSWVSMSFYILILSLSISGYMLVKFFLAATVEPEKKKMSDRKGRKHRK